VAGIENTYLLSNVRVYRDPIQSNQ